MKAWLLDNFDGLRKLRQDEISEPVAAPGEAVVALEYAALNPADRHLAEGRYPAHPTLPHILGRDGFGTILGIAAGVTQFRTGDRVIVLRSEIGVGRPGTFAEKVAVPVESLAAAPVGWSDEQAAGAALVYLTALQALTQWGALKPSVVLVTGASGGVGVACVQLGIALGHRMVGLSRSAEKRDVLMKMGASMCFDPGDMKWVAALKAGLGQDRVELAIDNVGGALLSEVVSTLGYGGKVSLVGRAAGAVPDFNTGALFFRRLKMGGVAVGSYTPAESQAAWNEIVETLDRVNERPRVDSIFSFDDLPAGFDRLEKGPMGKVLLKVRQQV